MATKKTKKAIITAIVDEEVVLVTKEGLKSLQEELEELKNVGRREVAGRLKEAISYGDLSENSEYEEAKNEQAFIEGRILDLEYKIKHAQVIDEKHHSKKIIEIGTKVKFRATKKKSEEYDITLVGSTESDAINNRISNESPLGMALLGAKVGEKVKVDAPAGITEYEVLKLA